MRLLLAIALLSSVGAEAQGRYSRFSRCAQGRSDRGLPCDDLATLEFAPASGAGLTAACACASVSGARGETVTFARTGVATCSPLGTATTGIATASLVECATGTPRVEASGTARGLRIEGARTNSLLRFIDYANVLWTDVSTPTLTGAQPSPWTGTYANLAVQFDDDSAVAQEGRAQTVTVTAAAVYTMSCYVKAGSLADATISLDGTTASVTGISSSTWTIISVTDASTSGVAVSAQVLNGDAVGDTGTVVWGGCQVEAGAYRTSMIPTTGATVTRNAESAYVTVAAFSPQSLAATADVPYTSSAAVGTNRRVVRVDNNSSDVDVFEMFWPATNFMASYVSVSSVAQTRQTAAGLSLPGLHRLAGWRIPSTTQAVIADGAETTAATALGALPVLNRVHLGVYPAAGFELDGVLSLVQVDTSPTRAR
mgnify:CR=1 FL=1